MLQGSVEGLKDQWIGLQGKHLATAQGHACRLPGTASVLAAVDAIIRARQKEIGSPGNGKQGVDPPLLEALTRFPRFAPISRLPQARRCAHSDEVWIVWVSDQRKHG
jgi:hypothetical protein